MRYRIKLSMDSALKNASKTYISFRLRIFYTLLSYDLWFFKIKFNKKDLKNLTYLETTQTRFGFIIENYSGIDVPHSMNT